MSESDLNDLLSFTDTVPTESGWYWVDRFDRIEKSIVWVGKRGGHDYLAVCETCLSGNDYKAVHRMNAKWAGPIPMPV